MSNAFTTAGPVPQSTPSLNISSAGSTPQSKALDNYGTGSGTNAIAVPGAPASFNLKTATPIPAVPNSSTNQTPGTASPSYPGLINQTPSTAMKSQSVVHPDGTTVTNTYHAPAAPSTQNTVNQPAQPQNNPGVTGQYTNPLNQAQQTLSIQNQENTAALAPNSANYATGGISTLGSTTTDGGNGATNTINNPLSSPQSGTTQNDSSYGGLINTLANEQNNPYNQSAQNSINSLTQAAQGNQALGQNAQNIANQASTDIKNTGILGVNTGLSYSGELAPIGEGNALAANNAAVAREQAIASGAQVGLQGNAQALTAQGQEQSGYNSAAGQALTGQGQSQAATGAAAGYAQPASQFGLLTNPITGQPIGGSGITNAGQTGTTGIPLIDNAVSNAMAAYKAGTPLAQAEALLPGGDAGTIAQQAFLAQVKNSSGIPNITAQAAQNAQNNAQGQQAQQQAFTLNQGLQNLNAMLPYATQILTTSGLNPTDSADLNAPINTYIKSLGNTAAANQLTSIMNDIQNYSAQIIASKNPGTPTSNTEITASTDPSSLSLNELKTVLATWNILGQTQLGIAQSASTNSYGGTSGYTGPAANPSSSIPTAAQNTNIGSGVKNPVAQAAAGLGLDTVGGISSILSKGGSVAAGAVGGAAEAAGSAILKAITL